jgi:DNA-binding FrmR family transcriptional regulator
MPMSGADGGWAVINEETKRKAMARLNRIEGQVQGVQRMVEEEKYCVDILLQISAIQGALEQVRKILLGRHIQSCVSEAMASGRAGDRQKKIEELLEVFSRYGR